MDRLLPVEKTTTMTDTSRLFKRTGPQPSRPATADLWHQLDEKGNPTVGEGGHRRTDDQEPTLTKGYATYDQSEKTYPSEEPGT